jgi:hypothetical protein
MQVVIVAVTVLTIKKVLIFFLHSVFIDLYYCLEERVLTFKLISWILYVIKILHFCEF